MGVNNSLYNSNFISNKLNTAAVAPATTAPQQQQAPSILDNPAVKGRMVEYAEKYSGVDPLTMDDNVRNGEKLVEQLKNCPDIKSVGDMVDKLPDAEKKVAVKNLMWFLAAKTAETNEMFTSGSIKLQDPGGKVNAFIEFAGKGYVYDRGSTHLQEHRINGEKQRGLDLRDIGMPANKRTLLYDGKSEPGTLFLKMEERGFPPVWKKGFRTWGNLSEFIGHCGTFLHTRIKKGGIGIKQARKEHVPEKTKTAFSDLLQKVQSSKTAAEIKADIKEGKTFGLSRMDSILKKTENEISQQPGLKQKSDQELIDQFRKDHLHQLRTAEEKGYTGNVKGNEVVLAAIT